MQPLTYNKIAFGGGCHWCTEAMFQAFRGVHEVQQGWIASTSAAAAFPEAVIVKFDDNVIPQSVLIAAHLHTHSPTSNHILRGKYRSAVYVFSEEQATQVRQTIESLQVEFTKPLLTQVLPFKAFKPSPEHYQNYYQKRPERPFCQTYIEPKLKTLLERYPQKLRKNISS